MKSITMPLISRKGEEYLYVLYDEGYYFLMGSNLQILYNR